MKIYNSIPEYLSDFKPGDIIVFEGTGIMDGLKNICSKWSTFKVTKETTPEKLWFKAFSGKTSLYTVYLDQQIAVLTKQEFSKLPK